MNRREVLVGSAMLGAVGLLDRSALASKSDLIAKTTAGRVRGCDVGEGIVCFKGVSYGLDTAQTRFAPPKPPAPGKTFAMHSNGARVRRRFSERGRIARTPLRSGAIICPPMKAPRVKTACT